MRITAAGSLPGDDFRGAVGAMAEALPEFLPLPELPARGVGSQFVGRTLALIDDLGFDLQPAGWRLVPGDGSEHRRAKGHWRSDLDAAEELLQDFDGVLKVAVAGPWSLAALVERPTGDRLLADHGARRELAQALDVGVRALVADLSRRVPHATVQVQLDEPLLVAVATGAVPTASGFSRHRSVDAAGLTAPLAPIAPGAILHCCAPGDWLPAAQRAGFAGASIDTRVVNSPAAMDRVGEWLASGRRLIAGIVDTASLTPQSTDALVKESLRLLQPLELDPTLVRDAVDLGTGCGLAGWNQRDVVGQLARLRDARDLVAERL